MSELNKIVEVLHGSYAYGYATITSDHDIRGVYLPEPREILLGTHKKSINRDAEWNGKLADLEHFSLDKYIHLLNEGQTLPVELLFLGEDTKKYNHPVWKQIIDNRYKFISKNFAGFVGFCRAQASRYSMKGNRIQALKSTISFLEKLATRYGEKSILGDHALEIKEFVGGQPKDGTISVITLVDNLNLTIEHLDVLGRKSPFHTSILHALNIYRNTLGRYGSRAEKAYEMKGADFKALLHSQRVAEEAIEILDTGRITFPRPNANYLLRIKRGEIPLETIINQVDEYLNYLDTKTSSSSLLREKPDYKFSENFIVQVYRDVVMENA